MSCITLVAHPMAMATTQLAHAIHYHDLPTPEIHGVVDRNPVRMSWVVVTDENGNRMLKMRWTPSADSR